METTLLKSIIVDLPFTDNQLRLYLFPLLLAISFIPLSILVFLKYKRRRPFYPFSMADYSLKFTKDKLFQIEDRMSCLRLITLVVLALSFPAPAWISYGEHRLAHKSELPPKEGSALFIVLDQSKSMGRQVGSTRLIDQVKAFTTNFIQSLDKNDNPERKDLIGLMGFARYAYVVVPPTFEHDILIDAIHQFDVISSKEGEGTSISYALYKTSHLIHFLQESAKKTHFNLDSSAILLITDGVEMISPDDVNKPYISISMEESAAYAAKHHIPLYLAVIFPQLNDAVYAPQKKSLQSAARLTRGELFVLNNVNEVDGVLKRIESLKKAPIAPADASTHQNEYPVWPYLLWAGFILFLFYVYLEYYHYRMAP